MRGGQRGSESWGLGYDSRVRYILRRPLAIGRVTLAAAMSHSDDSLSSGSDSTPPTPPNLHQNTIDPAARWLVQKYGGTSVGKFAAKIAEDILPYALVRARSDYPGILNRALLARIWTSTRSPSSARRGQARQRRWARRTCCCAPRLRHYNGPIRRPRRRARRRRRRATPGAGKTRCRCRRCRRRRRQGRLSLATALGPGRPTRP